MLTKIKLFAYIQQKIYKNKSLFFLNIEICGQYKTKMNYRENILKHNVVVNEVNCSTEILLSTIPYNVRESTLSHNPV